MLKKIVTKEINIKTFPTSFEVKIKNANESILVPYCNGLVHYQETFNKAIELFMKDYPEAERMYVIILICHEEDKFGICCHSTPFEEI